ncbi:class II aldolase/adducin family protein [Hydrogenobacter thermophilus]|uniref:class II aldolase/adducin family protein n=1 Tax=Hydrogenobacter thermophilus TaxID=940 RepID=UPI0030F8D38C
MLNHYVKKLIAIGKLLFEEGLVDARAGNLSVRIGTKLLITRRGSHLGMLTKEDFILLDIEKESLLDERASSELAVHRAVYLKTDKRALVHAHPPLTVKLSFTSDLIVPKDSEGRDLLKRVRVIPELPSGSYELAQAVVQILKEENILSVRGHGVFSADTEPFYAYSHISVLEHSCKILLDE